MKKYPFKFLDAYSREDAAIFFGRGEEIDQLYEMVFQSNILLIYGASGTGKTSLIQCGLASRFQSHDWLPLLIRRGSNINASLAKALADAGGDEPAGEENDMDWLDEVMEEGDTAVAVQPLSPLAQSLKQVYLHFFRPVYLIFDQFEELFILGTAAEQEAFIAAVIEILGAEQPVKMIFSVREEYLGYLDKFERAVPQLLRKKLRVEPMNLDKVKQVVTGAAGFADSNVHLQAGEEEKIAEGIFDKLRSKDKALTIELPYLQVFLDKLYLQLTGDETRQTDALFTLEALQKMGDIGDVLRNFLEEQVIAISRKLVVLFQQLTADTIWKVLSHFATLEGTKEPLGKEGLYDRLPDMDKAWIDAIVQALIGSRILRDTSREGFYELSHDSLAKQVAEKRSDEEIALLEVKRLIQNQAALKKNAREKFTRKQLNFIAPFLPKIKLTEGEKTLIAESRRDVARRKADAKKRREKEIEDLQEKQRLLEKNRQSQKRFLQGLGIALVLMIGLAVWAFSQRQQAQNNFAKADTALAQANKLIDAFYFYDGKFALSQKQVDGKNKYGFINRNGDVVIDYQYDKAEPFDENTGFAKVKKVDKYKTESLIDFLIDTTGNEYKLATKVTELVNDVLALDVSNGNIDIFPPKIYQHTPLQLLWMNRNELTALPAGIGELNNLQVLGLSNNQIEQLPDEIGKLEALQTLDIRSNSLAKLPAVIGNLSALQTLDLGGNELTELPAVISRLPHLKSLNLSFNKLEALPAAILNVNTLQRLELVGNGLTTLPAEIDKLQNLESLSLSNNQLKALPTNIGNMKALQVLVVEGNKLSKFPTEISKLQNLEMLSLSGNQLKEIPDGIKRLSTLERLDFSRNNLISLPAEIGTLQNLESLNLFWNQLKVIPTSIGNMNALRTLSLGGNQLTTLPVEIGTLQNLESLNLTKNQIKTIPTAIGDMNALQMLGLSGNQLTTLPTEIGKLHNLRFLYLAANQLSELPADIDKLVNLQNLDVRNNALTTLPPNIGKLQNLKLLILSGNPVPEPELQRIRTLLPNCEVVMEEP